MKRLIIIILVLLTVNCFSSTWGAVYPYIQKTENNNIKCHSIPYGVYDGPHGLGQTFIYSKGQLLYSIDKYFSTPFFTVNNGQILVEIDFSLNYFISAKILNDSGRFITTPIDYDGKAINIYKEGKLSKTIYFKELKIDTAKIKVNKWGNWFSWNYRENEDKNDRFNLKMIEHPAFIEDTILYIISADNQLISIDVLSGQIVNRQNAYKLLKSKKNWKPKKIKRKFEKVNYPPKFTLPNLVDNSSIEQGLLTFLGLNDVANDRDNAVIKIYFHTLLINKEGKCEIVHTSPSKPLVKIKNYNDDIKQLEVDIESWIMEQTFDIKTIPKNFPKFKFSDFVYLK